MVIVCISESSCSIIGQSCSLSARMSVSWRGCAAGMGGALCISLAEFSVFAELFILGSAVS